MLIRTAGNTMIGKVVFTYGLDQRRRAPLPSIPVDRVGLEAEPLVWDLLDPENTYEAVGGLLVRRLELASQQHALQRVFPWKTKLLSDSASEKSAPLSVKKSPNRHWKTSYPRTFSSTSSAAATAFDDFASIRRRTWTLQACSRPCVAARCWKCLSPPPPSGKSSWANPEFGDAAFRYLAGERPRTTSA